jgi:uncharacterized membrane protein
VTSALTGVATGFGLSAAAGLNAYLPLLIVALMARFTTYVKLEPPYDVLTSWWVIGVLAVLALIELVVDKVPAVDSVNDVIQTFIRPLAGAILFASNANLLSDMHPALALACGLMIAGGVHATKATARPIVTGTTGGLLNPVVSFLEDVLSVITTILAILMPVLLVFLVLLFVGLFLWWKHRRNSRKQILTG